MCGREWRYHNRMRGRSGEGAELGNQRAHPFDDAHPVGIPCEPTSQKRDVGHPARAVWYAYDNNGPWGRLIGATPALSAAGVAYGETYKWTVGATLTKACSIDGNGTWVCSLMRPGGYQGGDCVELDEEPQQLRGAGYDG